jgi:hypothetical protein
MKKNSKLAGMIIIWAMVIGFTGNSPVFSRYIGNTSENAFEEGTSQSGANAENFKSEASIRELIIRAAGFYFKASGNASHLSEQCELTDLEGFDYNQLNSLVNTTIQNMESAVFYYRELVYRANKTPYNQTVLNKLMDFDYRSFSIQNGLVKDIYDQVESYLKNGDIRGVYIRIKNDVEQILELLYEVRWVLYWGYIPANKIMWDLNQETAKLQLFGQYISRTFEAIK